MLAVLFSLGSRRHGLDAAAVERIVPALPLQALADAPAGLAGTFTYQGAPVPVIDLTRLMAGESTRPHLSSRIILVRHAAARGAPRLLGLLAEQVTEVRSITGLSADLAGTASTTAVHVVSLQELIPAELLNHLCGVPDAAISPP